MPLLKREPDVYPASLFALPPEENPWVVLHVRSRQEKLVARSLLTGETPFYLPQVEHVSRRAGRNFMSYLPLFPGYVFARAPRKRHDAYFHDAVVHAIAVEDQERFAAELRQIHVLQESGARLIPYPEVKTGDPVRITAGVFAGYTGTVVREKGTELLVITVSVIRHCVAVELGRDAVTPADLVAAP